MGKKMKSGLVQWCYDALRIDAAGGIGSLKFVCVVNPVSGKGMALPRARRVAGRLEKGGHGVHILETSPEMDTFRRRCAVIDEETRVICFGGDGTLLHFLNCCPHFHGVAFYGMGTANVITHEFGIPRHIDPFVAMLEKDRRLLIRPGETDDGTRFLMMYSFGIDGFVLAHVSQRLKNRFGKLAFIPAFIKALFQYTYPRCSLTLDGKKTFSGSFVLVSRIEHYAGKFSVAPLADPCSDVFQVTVLEKGGVWSTLRFAFSFLRGGKKTGVVQTVARRVAIRVDNPCYNQLDGDLCKKSIAELTVSRVSIPLIVP